MARRRRTDQPGSCSPTSSEQARTFDFFIFFSFRYYHAYHGARARRRTRPSSCRRPSATARWAWRSSAPVFRGVRALMYNSFEERALIQTVSGNHEVPGVVVGVGSEIPAADQPARVPPEVQPARSVRDLRRAHRREQGLRRAVRLLPALLADARRRHAPRADRQPDHPDPRSSADSSPRLRRAIRTSSTRIAAAELLIMPSYFESLSMVALEAWALGKPVLANGRCDVLKGQCIRSNGGLYYDNFEEFVEDAAGDRFQSVARRGARAQRARVLQRALRVAGHRAEVPRHAGEARCRRAATLADAAAARLVGAATPGSRRRPTRSSRSCRRAQRSAIARRRASASPLRRPSRPAAAPNRANRERPRDASTPQPRPAAATSRCDRRVRRASATIPASEAAGRRRAVRRDRQASHGGGDRVIPAVGRRSARRAGARAADRGGRAADDHDITPSTRSWRRSATAMPSATRCWAFSACCAGRLRVGDLRRDRRRAVSRI